MVRFTFPLSAPADQQQHGNRIHVFIRKTGQRIDGVSLPAVLHIDKRDLPRGEIVSGSKGNRVAFVGSDHIPVSAMGQRIIAEAVQVGIRYTGKIADTVVGKRFENLFLIEHLLLLPSDAALALIQGELLRAVPFCDRPGLRKCFHHVIGQWSGLDSLHVLLEMVQL